MSGSLAILQPAQGRWDSKDGDDAMDFRGYQRGGGGGGSSGARPLTGLPFSFSHWDFCSLVKASTILSLAVLWIFSMALRIVSGLPFWPCCESWNCSVRTLAMASCTISFCSSDKFSALA